MVGVVNENMVIRTAVNNLTTAAFYRVLISKDDSKEVIYIYFLACVVLHDMKSHN